MKSRFQRFRASRRKCTQGCSGFFARGASRTGRISLSAGLPLALNYILWSMVFLLVVPFAVVNLLGSPGSGASSGSPTSQGNIYKVDIPKYVSVHITDTGRTKKVKFEDYITCVVASEMPYTFEHEALKAQAVAARTYTLAKIAKYDIKHPASHPTAAICDTTHCQVYKTKKELIRIHDDGWEELGFDKIAKAVHETRGQVMYHDGKLVMQALFFSSSGGRTENSEDVFVGTYPYLVSVESPYETKATHQDEKTTLTIKSLVNKMKAKYPDYTFGSTSSIEQDDIRITARTNGGRVKTMNIGKAEVTGTQVRNALDLSSTLFDISFGDGSSTSGNSGSQSAGSSKNSITFTTSGSGHGVGMSQYGANGMADKGYTYDQILKHYYTGVQIH